LGLNDSAPPGALITARGTVFSDADKEQLRGERPSSGGHLVEFDDKTPVPGTCPIWQR
jgi:hypothetical protein